MLLGCVPCASSGTLSVSYDLDGNISKGSCSICDCQPSGSSDSSSYDCSDSQEAIAAFTNIMQLAEFEQSRRPRVLAMVALRSFALHFDSSILLSLEKSLLGQWCLRSLRSSMRELRVTAGFVNSPLSIVSVVLLTPLSQSYTSFFFKKGSWT